jgi:hypothetical protein
MPANSRFKARLTAEKCIARTHGQRLNYGWPPRTLAAWIGAPIAAVAALAAALWLAFVLARGVAACVRPARRKERVRTRA